MLKEEAMHSSQVENDMSLDALAARQRANNIPSIVSCSGKMVLIDKLLPKLQAEGHRVLIFSQFVMMLDILEEYCQLRNYKVARIDGQTKGSERQQAIDAFSRKGSDYFIFLLSTRAGGLGINLTAADTVIIYDSDWNPQNDSQATARCHRIGQKQEVTVYRLLTRNTYEAEMFNRASRKLAIETVVLREKTIMGDKEKEEGSEKKMEEEKIEDGNEKKMEVEEKVEEGSEKKMEVEEESAKNELASEFDDLEEICLSSDEETISIGTTKTDVHSTITEKSEKSQKSEKPDQTDKLDKPDNEYNIPEAPFLPQKKRRGRKPTKVDKSVNSSIDDELSPYKRSKNEVEEMLRRGLFDCMMNGSAATSLEFFDEDIDTILEKNTRSVILDYHDHL